MKIQSLGLKRGKSSLKSFKGCLEASLEKPEYIDMCFTWRKTKQGWHFWEDYYRNGGEEGRRILRDAINEIQNKDMYVENLSPEEFL